MPSDTKYLLVENFEDPELAKAFLLEYNWIVSNGFIQVKLKDGRGVFSADLRNMFCVSVVAVTAKHKTRDTHVKACRVKMEFDGGKYLQTRVYPSDIDVPYRIVFALLLLRDHYTNFTSDVPYSLSVMDIDYSSMDRENFLLDDSDYNWSDTDEQ